MQVVEFSLRILPEIPGTLTIIIPTPSISSPHLKNCLSSISRSTLAENTRILVVISSGDEFNFSRSLNTGINLSSNSDILILNDDCILSENSIRLLLEAKEEGVGIIGSVLRFPNHEVQHNGGIVEYNFLKILLRDTKRKAPFFSVRSKLRAIMEGIKYVRFYQDFLRVPRRLDFVTGALMLIPENIVPKVGLFDERFKNGFEDVDYCLRVKQRGLKIKMIDAIVTHKEHQTLKGSNSNFFENLKYFNSKWHTKTLSLLKKV